MACSDRLSHAKVTSHVTRRYFGVGDRVRNNYSITEHSFPTPLAVLLGSCMCRLKRKGNHLTLNFKPCSSNGSLWNDVK